METFKLRIRKNRAVHLEILTLNAPSAKTRDSNPTVTWDFPLHANNKWITSHIKCTEQRFRERCPLCQCLHFRQNDAQMTYLACG